jgi:glycosyltransferase involved in cell wall biosynthesis
MQSKPKNIKILFILSALHQDGAVLSTLTTLKHLDRSCFSPQLFVIKQSKPSEDENSWSNLLEGIEVIYGLNEGEKLAWNTPKLLGKLYNLAKQSDIIIGGLEMTPTFLAALTGKLTGKPSLGFVRNSLPDLLAGLPFYFKVLTQLIYPMLTGCISISNGIKQGTEKLIPQLKGRISTVYIPIDIDQIKQLAETPLPESESFRPFMLAVGRLMPQKGFDILIRAFSLALERGLQQTLVIVGEGKERPKLEKLIADLDLKGKVVLAGFQGNPYSWMKNAEIFVSSSRFEGFCRVLAEAQAVGTPVVSTDCPNGPTEVLQDGHSGILVLNENAEALATGMLDLVYNPQLRAIFRARGIERVEDFKLKTTISAFENILKTIMEKQKSAKHKTTIGLSSS